MSLTQFLAELPDEPAPLYISKKAEVKAGRQARRLSGLFTIIAATLTRLEEHQAKGDELVAKLKTYMGRLDDAE